MTMDFFCFSNSSFCKIVFSRSASTPPASSMHCWMRLKSTPDAFIASFTHPTSVNRPFLLQRALNSRTYPHQASPTPSCFPADSPP